MSLIPINNYIQAYVQKSILHDLFGNKTRSSKTGFKHYIALINVYICLALRRTWYPDRLATKRCHSSRENKNQRKHTWAYFRNFGQRTPFACSGQIAHSMRMARMKPGYSLKFARHLFNVKNEANLYTSNPNRLSGGLVNAVLIGE